MKRGRLFSFEGLDGAGKTTQIKLLTDWFDSQGLAHLSTREPGGSPLGQEIRHLLLYRPDLEITPLAEAFLFQADRAQHFASVILPALATGMHVITDRCLDSSIAYQGAARGIGTDLVTRLSLLATQEHVPDLTFFLDLDPAMVRQRTEVNEQHGRSDVPSHFDQAAEPFQQHLRQAFLDQATRYPTRITVLDASQPVSQLHQQILALVKPLL